jgi:hypothetical protein
MERPSGPADDPGCHLYGIIAIVPLGAIFPGPNNSKSNLFLAYLGIQLPNLAPVPLPHPRSEAYR